MLEGVGGPTSGELSGAALRLLDEHPDITALVAPQEQSVIGALRAARVRGVRVPELLSVVGMVSEPMAEIATPALTTIDFPADEMGGVAARILLGRVVGGRTAPEQVLVRPTLTIRESTGTPGH